jgi:hypothetical protein
MKVRKSNVTYTVMFMLEVLGGGIRNARIIYIRLRLRLRLYPETN